MRPRSEIIGNSRIRPSASVLGLDSCEYHGRGWRLLCVWGVDEKGFEHVSVSPEGSKCESDQPCPTWQQMCEVKRAFFADDEMVVQVHPSEEKYFHGPGIETNILHLWRPADGDWSKLEEVMDV